MFAYDPGDRCSISDWVIPMTPKMVLDVALLNTQHYKVWIKGKIKQSEEKFAPSTQGGDVAIEKGAYLLHIYIYILLISYIYICIYIINIIYIYICIYIINIIYIYQFVYIYILAQFVLIYPSISIHLIYIHIYPSISIHIIYIYIPVCLYLYFSSICLHLSVYIYPS